MKKAVFRFTVGIGVGLIAPFFFEDAPEPEKRLKGTQGDKGMTGEKGTLGDKGMTGNKGTQGDKGDKGETGNKATVLSEMPSKEPKRSNRKQKSTKRPGEVMENLDNSVPSSSNPNNNSGQLSADNPHVQSNPVDPNTYNDDRILRILTVATPIITQTVVTILKSTGVIQGRDVISPDPTLIPTHQGDNSICPPKQDTTTCNTPEMTTPSQSHSTNIIDNQSSESSHPSCSNVISRSGKQCFMPTDGSPSQHVVNHLLQGTPHTGQTTYNEASITSAGSAIPSNKVAFHVRLTSHVTLGSKQTVIFDHVITNIGKAYNQHTGHFTAPFDGLYFFACTFLQTGSTSLHLQIVQNSSEISKGYASSVGEIAGSMNVVVYLHTGDVVKVRHYPGRGSETIHGDWSFFTGYLL